MCAIDFVVLNHPLGPEERINVSEILALDKIYQIYFLNVIFHFDFQEHNKNLRVKGYDIIKRTFNNNVNLIKFYLTQPWFISIKAHLAENTLSEFNWNWIGRMKRWLINPPENCVFVPWIIQRLKISTS